MLPKSFIRWAFSRGNSCADPEGDREHERVKRGDRGPDSPSKMTSYMGFYRNKHLDPVGPPLPGKCWTPSETLEKYSLL